MTVDDLRQSLTATEPPAGLTIALVGLGQSRRTLNRDEAFSMAIDPRD
jgi:hypothetical protein